MATVDRVIELVTDMAWPNQDVKPESKFAEDLGMDSLDRIELMMQVEENWGVEISDEDGEKLATPAEVAEFVDKKVGNK